MLDNETFDYEESIKGMVRKTIKEIGIGTTLEMLEDNQSELCILTRENMCNGDWFLLGQKYNDEDWDNAIDMLDDDIINEYHRIKI